MANITGKTSKAFIYRTLSFLTGSPVAPEIKTAAKRRREKYPVIPFFTHYNDFAVMLSMLSEVVPEHDAAIRAKKRWVCPSGFTLVNSDPSMLLNVEREDKEISNDDIASVNEFISDIDGNGANLKDIVRQVVCDLETVGNAYIEIVRGYVAGEPFINFHHHDPTTALLIRREDVVSVGFCSDWKNLSGRNSKVTVDELPLYKGNRTDWQKESGTERAVMHLKQYRAGRFFYGLPESIASMTAQRIGFEINRHNLDRLETDFFPRLFFEFFNVDGMTEQEQEHHLNQMMNTFTKEGGNRYGIFAQYNDHSDSKTKVHKLEVDKTGDFIDYRKQVRQDILTAHGVHPVIAGVQVAGSLGSSKEIRDVFQLFNSTVIEPMQDYLIESLITPLMKMSSAHLNEFDCLFLTMSTAMPISFMGDLDINALLTKNEGREVIGYSEMMTDEERDARGDLLINSEPL